MIVQFAILAQGIAVDRFSNRLSIFNVCESIDAPHFPILVPELAFVVVVRREPNDPVTFDTILNVQLGQMAVGQANLHIDFEASIMNRQVTNFQGLPIFMTGELQFSFNLPDGARFVTAVPVVQNPALPPLPQVQLGGAPGAA